MQHRWIPGQARNDNGFQPLIRIISNNTSNRFLNRVQVIPITSNIERVYPGECYISVNRQKRKALANQIATVTKERFDQIIGVLSNSDMVKIEQALKIQLELT
mgnify:CR=1 FL=1